VLLVVIGKRWAGTGRVGKRRIDSPADFVRLEVAGGLRRQGLRIIPVLVGGATMPGPTELPDDIKDLARRNAFELSDTRWKDDVARLIAQLDAALGPVALAPAPSAGVSTPTPAKKTITLPVALPTKLPPWAKWAGIGAGLLVVALLVRGLVGHGSASAPPTVPASAPTQLTIAPDAPKALPTDVPDAAQKSLDDTRQQWRQDAVLTQVNAKLHADQSPAGVDELDYAFRSPTDGNGIQIITGLSGAKASSKSLTPVSRTAIHPLPASFVDFPAAVQAARDAGLAGDVRSGLLTASFVEHHGPVWRLLGSGDDPVFVDGASGAVLHGTFTLAAGAGSTHSGQNPIQALKGLFKKH
jgi:hypothetical protein